MSRIVIGTHDGKPVALPNDVVTSTLVVYGGKGMGKTNFGSVLVEELDRAKLRWSYLDPLGVAWGLRHSADGNGAGVKCVILGGAHGDIPIEPTGGAVVADLVVDEPTSVIIDFSRKPSGEMWGIGEKIRFVTEYTKRLFQRQGGLVNGHRREPLFQILDEAARYVPQIIPHGNPQLSECLSAWETLVEEGRNVGIGVGLLTQRSARMSKSVSEVADAMFSFRIVGPNSIGAVTDWLGEHIEKERIKQTVQSIRSLERGTCLLVSPGWMQFEGIVKIRPRETFDSSATPKPGERQKRVTGEGAKPDLAKYAARMHETIERAKENDPTKLKVRIRELEKELAKGSKVVKVAPKVVNDPRVLERELANAEKHYRKQTADMANQLSRELLERMRQVKNLFEFKSEFKFEPYKIQGGEIQSKGSSLKSIGMASNGVTLGVPTRKPTNPRPDVSPMDGSGELRGPHLKILKALGELYSIDKKQPVREMVAAWAGYAVGGSAFSNPLGALRTWGYIEYPSPGAVALTGKGFNVCGVLDAPDQEEISRRILNILKGPERKILSALMESREILTRQELADRSGYAVGGSAFSNPLGALRTAGFVEYPSAGSVKVADWLFI